MASNKNKSTQSRSVELSSFPSSYTQMRLSQARSGILVDNMFHTWTEVSGINYLSKRIISDYETNTPSSIGQRSSKNPLSREDLAEVIDLLRLDPSAKELLASERFITYVTPLLNEKQLWGCFYTFPRAYEDKYSPIVRVRNEEDIPDIVDGVLTRDLVSICLSYLKRIPILGDWCYIKLNLADKGLVNIQVLQHYRYLVYLDLSFNHLDDLSVLSHLLYIQYLSVNHNKLTTVLEYDVPQWYLTEVHYKGNFVKNIRDLTMFWSITVLDLSKNNITYISGLENLHYLRRLDLSFNHIKILRNLNNLKLLWLDVSYNNINSFEIGSDVGLWTLRYLQYLNLDENNITSLQLLARCTRIEEVHARNNRIDSLLDMTIYMQMLQRLRVLDFRTNPLCDRLGYKEVVINTFPNLMCLDNQELDPVEQRYLKMKMSPDVRTFANRRLLRLLYIEQLSRARVSPFVMPADTTEVPIVILVGYEAVGKGTLARRLAKECSSHIELAIQHTTAVHHHPNHYRRVTRNEFDEMLVAGEFLTYTEFKGESYGLSREEAFVKDGKVKLAYMDLTSALMLKLRGRKPFLILATCKNKSEITTKQKERHHARMKFGKPKSDSSSSSSKSSLQILLSGELLVNSIIDEILANLPVIADQGESSSISLMLNNNDSGNVHSTYMMTPSKEKVDTASLCSLYKDSDVNDTKGTGQKMDFQSVPNSACGTPATSKSVSFCDFDYEPRNSGKGSLTGIDRTLTGLILDNTDNDVRKEENLARTYSKSLRLENCIDKWFKFLFEHGLYVPSEVYSETYNAEVKTDIENIVKGAVIYRTMPSPTLTTNIRDDYEDVHLKRPGLFWDTVIMDDPDDALKKTKKIIKDIVNYQNKIKPMFDINFNKESGNPITKKKIHAIAKAIAPFSQSN